MMRQTGVVVLAVGVAGVVAACSSSSPGGRRTISSSVGAATPPPGPPRAAIDPCALLTLEQASTIIGEPAAPGHRNGQACRWDGTAAAGPFVSIDVISKTLYDGAANTVPSGVTKTSVDGIGDEAFVKDTGQAGHILWFRTGDRYVKVDAFAVRGPMRDLDAEKQVARYVLQKL